MPPGFVLDSAPAAPRHSPWSGQSYVDAARSAGVGIAKGLGNTAVGLGEMVHSIPGFASGMDEILGQPGVSETALKQARAMTAPSNTVEKVAAGGEQMAEFALLPGPAKMRGVARALEMGKAGLASAGLAKTQGASGTGVVVAGALGGLPVAQGVAAVGKWAGNIAPKAVRSALKPTVASLKKIAGASVEGIDAKAEQLMTWILTNRVTTANKARTIFQQAESELQRVLSLKGGKLTDEPARAVRYLEALERSASKQRLPASDVATIRNAAAELIEGSLGKDVVKMVPAPHPTLVDASGKAITVLVPETTRALRAGTPAAEALEAARSSGRWQTRKQWGELKGTETEARKAVERAGRDAVKTAVPEAAPLLRQESMALKAEEVLDRASQRAANRDQLSLPGLVVAAPEVAAGKVPVMAFAVNWLRNNQMKAGIYADVLAKAIEKGDTGRVVSILHKLGVGSGAQLAPAGP